MRRTLPCTVRLAGPRDNHDDGLMLKGVGASNADTGEVGLSGV